MKVKDGFVVCAVGGKTVAVASGDLCRSFTGMINLNATGEMLFKMLQKGTTEDEMTAAIVEEYKISETQASADVRKFIAPLQKAGLLIQ